MRWCIQLAGPGRYGGSGEVLSFKPGVAVQHSRFLLTITLPRTLLSARLTVLSQARCVCVERLLRPLCLSVYSRNVRNGFDRRIADFPEAPTTSAFCCRFKPFCSELIKIDQSSVCDQWPCYFGYACLPGCTLINDNAILCVCVSRPGPSLGWDERERLS